MQVESILVGVIIASLTMVVWNKVCDFKAYIEFKAWCKSQNIDEDDLNKDNLPRYWGMWRLSQIDGVEFVRHKDEDDVKRGKD